MRVIFVLHVEIRDPEFYSLYITEVFCLSFMSYFVQNTMQHIVHEKVSLFIVIDDTHVMEKPASYNRTKGYFPVHWTLTC